MTRPPLLHPAVVAVAALLVTAPAAVARAQQQQQQGQQQQQSARRLSSSLDVGVSSVRYADTVDASAATLTTGLRLESTRAAAGALGTFAQTGAGAWVMQGVLDGSVYTPATIGGLVGELAADVGGSAHEDGTRTGETIATARAHLMRVGHGAWLGGGGGRAWDGAAWHSVALGEAGLWWSGARGTALVATATPTAVDVGGTVVRYTDASLSARWAGPRAELSGSLGTRVGGDTVARLGGSASWGSVAAAVWIVGPLALAVSGGNYPVDYTQGYPGGRFVTAALRIATRPASRDSAVPAATLALPQGGERDPGAATAPRLELLPAPPASDPPGAAATTGERRTLLVSVPRAASAVDVSGDFTNWDPVPLAPRADGRWSVVLPLEPGVHQVVVRVNGGAWRVPLGLATIDDEFGGVAGLLEVAPAAPR